MVLNNAQINLRADTAANWNKNNPTLGVSEIGIDRTNYEIKIGNGGTWNQTQNFIANNTTVKAIQSTANTANSRASQAITTAQYASNAANQANEFRELMINACFPTYPRLYEETLFSDSKLNHLERIAELCANNFQDRTQCRVTDTVTIDLLYALIGIIFKAMGKSNEELHDAFARFFAWWKDWAYNAPADDRYIRLEEMMKKNKAEQVGSVTLP